MPDITKHLYEVIAAIQSPEEAEALFSDLCTYKEIEYMAQRIESARLLMEGHTYQQVNDAVQISSATLSRVNRCVQHGNGYNVFLRHYFENRKNDSH